MGLDTSHECWHGAYSAFHRWRSEIARVAGLPPLDLMEGFFQVSDGTCPLYFAYQSAVKNGLHNSAFWESLPIKWGSLKPSPLFTLLHHSDCEGELDWKDCGPIADALEELLPLLKGDRGGHVGDVHEKTVTFIRGLRQAFDSKENVDFH